MAFTKVPLLRGFEAIRPLYALLAPPLVFGRPIAYICGGYARYCASQNSSPVVSEDVDVFPSNTESYETLKTHLTGVLGFTIQHENHVSLTLNNPEATDLSVDIRWRMHPKIQLIKPVVEGRIVTTGTPEEILENFDFTIVRAMILDQNEVLVDEDFLEDEKHKLIRIKNIHCPISSTLRCMKYARKGYFMRPMQALQLFKDWDDRGEEYKKRMIELFEERSPSGTMTQQEIDELEALLRVD